MINVVWDNPEQTIIRLDYYEPVASWEEYRAAVNQACDMAGSVDYTVHVINNTGHAKMPPGKTHRAFDELTITVNDVPDNVGLLITVTLATIERRISRIVLQVLLKADTLQFHTVKSLETAYNLIHHYDNGYDLTALT